MSRSFLCGSFLAALYSTASVMAVSSPALADKIKHPIAVFSGLDKITGRIIVFEVATDETVQFGTLQITERVCYTRPSTEAPQTTTFVQVDEVDAANDYKRIFSGWMFASSPGLHGIEHPVYDIWLTGCKGGGETITSSESSEAAPEPAAPPPVESPKPPPQKPAPRPRRPPPPDDFGAALPPDQAPPPPPQNQGPIEVGPPPGFIPPQPADRRPAQQRFTYPGGTGDGPPDNGF